MTNEVQRTAWASAKKNAEFFCIETCSGYRMTTTDPQGKQHLLPVGASDHELGVAVLDAFAHSRFVSPLEHPEEDSALFDFDLSRKRYSEWVKTLMTTYGYKTKNALFREMKNCNIECRDALITIRPSHHDKLEAWSGDGISKESYVIISSNSPPLEIGAALRLAFVRCT